MPLVGTAPGKRCRANKIPDRSSNHGSNTFTNECTKLIHTFANHSSDFPANIAAHHVSLRGTECGADTPSQCITIGRTDCRAHQDSNDATHTCAVCYAVNFQAYLPADTHSDYHA